jgi:hypothetical protein
MTLENWRLLTPTYGAALNFGRAAPYPFNMKGLEACGVEGTLRSLNIDLCFVESQCACKYFYSVYLLCDILLQQQCLSRCA